MKAAQRFDESCIGLRITCNIHDLKFSGFDYIFNLYTQYRKFGTLPYPGSLSEQPNKIMECFNIFRAIQNEEEIKQNKKQEQLAKRRK